MRHTPKTIGTLALLLLAAGVKADDVRHPIVPQAQYQLVRFLVDDSPNTDGSLSNAEFYRWTSASKFYRYELIESEKSIAEFLSKRVSTKSTRIEDDILKINGVAREDHIYDWRASPIKKTVLAMSAPLALTVKLTDSALTKSAATRIGADESPEIRSDSRTFSMEASQQIVREPSELKDLARPSALLIPFGAMPIAIKPGPREDITPVISFRRIVLGEDVNALDLLSPIARSNLIDGEAASVFVSDSMALATSKRWIAQLRLKESELRLLRQIRNDIRVQILQGAMHVRMAASTTEATIDRIPEGDRRVLSTAFRGRSLSPKAAKPILFVIDDAWPSRSAYRQAAQFLVSTAKELWKERPPEATSLTTPDQAINTLLSIEDPGVPKGYVCDSLEICPTHAGRVSKAMNPYIEQTRLDNGELPVDIIYVPLSQAQRGAREFLSLLWTLHYTFRNDATVPSAAGYWDQRKLLTMEDFRDDFLQLVPTSLAVDEFSFTTNEGILTATITIAAQVAAKAKRPVFINTSWSTVRKLEVPVMHDKRVFLVAAAGRCNIGDCLRYVDELEPERYFANRGAANDMLLVMQSDRSGRVECNSSRLRKKYYVVAFDGNIDGDCGTSFAAPRVAWLLAAREAIVPTTSNPGGSWVESIGQRVASSERSKACVSDNDYSCLMLYVSTIFSASN